MYYLGTIKNILLSGKVNGWPSNSLTIVHQCFGNRVSPIRYKLEKIIYNKGKYYKNTYMIDKYQYIFIKNRYVIYIPILIYDIMRFNFHEMESGAYMNKNNNFKHNLYYFTFYYHQNNLDYLDYILGSFHPTGYDDGYRFINKNTIYATNFIENKHNEIKIKKILENYNDKEKFYSDNKLKIIPNYNLIVSFISKIKNGNILISKYLKVYSNLLSNKYKVSNMNLFNNIKNNRINNKDIIRNKFSKLCFNIEDKIIKKKILHKIIIIIHVISFISCKNNIHALWINNVLKNINIKI